jgi:hypothetical protein
MSKLRPKSNGALRDPCATPGSPDPAETSLVEANQRLKSIQFANEVLEIAPDKRAIGK